MASDSPYKQEFRIRDLSTRSVILFPTRAQIIRDIKEITLHPGQNQIVIDGLAPTVDEHSIKVEGTGAATITEVTVDLLPNREVYQDIYPSDSDDSSDDDEDEDDDDKVEAMKTVNDKIKQLNIQLLGKKEIINSAAKRLLICDNFGKSVTENRPPVDEIEALVKAYLTEREKIYAEHETASIAIGEIRESLEKVEKEKLKVAKAIVKAKEKAQKEKAKLKEKRLRQRAEIFKEKQRIKAERESFWPKKVYRVTINLEPTILTPGSSRRSSIDGDTVVNLATTNFHEPSSAPLKTGEINLSLSYITYSASWAPRYDLNLNSVKCNGVLEYGAELKNNTSETWKDAKIILSTSQTSFSGLSESIPIMLPWHVRLLRGAGHGENALFSNHELQAKQKEWSQTTGGYSQKPRGEIFGMENISRSSSTTQQVQLVSTKKKERISNMQQVLHSSYQPPSAPLAFGASVPGSSFGGAPVQNEMSRESVPSKSSKARRSLASKVAAPRFLRKESDDEMEEEYNDQAFSSFSDDPQAQSLTFEEGAWEESGMTTTYEVPASKTLAPSNSTTKHKIAKIDFKNIVFSHIVIGKLRQVAFLKARLRNTSRITLLKGPLGLTLDGSFLGQSSFPRCSSGEAFSLPLGVDPSITIAYSKPTVRRSQTGFINKEDTNVFTRTVTILNTKHNSSAELTVLDQIPVSEDERLKIEIVAPKGLKIGAEGIRTGQSATPVPPGGSVKGTAKDVRASVYGTGNDDGKWGTAVASAKKGGEVAWNVKLNPGCGTKLVLEYEASFPSGEGVVSAQK
jgi:hypothetical protein